MGMSSLQDLFRNLEEYEIDLSEFIRNDNNKKKKSLALKATTIFEDDLESSKKVDEVEELALLIKEY